jgi:predicted dehydrogenase
MSQLLSFDVTHTPPVPKTRPGIGIIGCGRIVRNQHLPAYVKHKLNVVGVTDPSADATRAVAEKFGITRAYKDADELLADPAIAIVDVPVHPHIRGPIMRKAIAAGKHVLAQKPLCNDVREAAEIVALAKRAGVKIAVNQNGRWSPPWRTASRLIQQGAIGEVMSVNHLFDLNVSWIVGGPFEKGCENFIIYDYSIHWIDITRVWLAGKTFSRVRAQSWRTPNQPSESVQDWACLIELQCTDGSRHAMNCVGCSQSDVKSHPFWIHGTRGAIRGSVEANDHVELDVGGNVTRFKLNGKWFPDGFAGSMGELICAIEANREPENSGENNLLSLQLTAASLESHRRGGEWVSLDASEITLA